MEFGLTVGIVVLLCALIILPFFLLELRKEKQKKQEQNDGDTGKWNQPAQMIELNGAALEYIKNNYDFWGECGDNFQFYSINDKILYLEGSGELYDGWDFYDNDFLYGIDRLFKLAYSKRIVISDGCTAIGDSVFDMDRDWNDMHSDHVEIEAPFEATIIDIPHGVTAIGERAFAGCSKLISLKVPETVTQIGKDAFLDVPHIVYYGPAQSEDNWGALSRN